MDPLAVLLHLRVGGIPIGDTASGADIAGLPPNLHLADGGRASGGIVQNGANTPAQVAPPTPVGVGP